MWLEAFSFGLIFAVPVVALICALLYLIVSEKVSLKSVILAWIIFVLVFVLLGLFDVFDNNGAQYAHMAIELLRQIKSSVIRAVQMFRTLIIIIAIVLILLVMDHLYPRFLSWLFCFVKSLSKENQG